MVARDNHFTSAPLHTLHAPYVCLRHALHAFYDWLRVPTTANHSLMHALYVHALCVPYAQFMNG